MSLRNTGKYRAPRANNSELKGSGRWQSAADR